VVDRLYCCYDYYYSYTVFILFLPFAVGCSDYLFEIVCVFDIAIIVVYTNNDDNCVIISDNAASVFFNV
jgi:hypothetical protein